MKQTKSAPLRERAEKILKSESGKTRTDNRSKDELIHELQGHKIELEMQNDELKRTQASLEEIGSKYFDLYNLAPVGYFIFDEKWIILEANLTGAKMLGTARSQIIKKPLNVFIHPIYQDTFHLYRRKLQKSDNPETCELKLRNDMFISLESINVTDEQGGRTGKIRSVFTDITGRKIVEGAFINELESKVEERTRELQALNAAFKKEIAERKRMGQSVLETEMRYAALFESTQDAIVVTDTSGTGRIISVNPAACHLFGYDEEEFLHLKLPREALIDTSDPRFSTFMDQLDKNGYAKQELKYKRKDGSLFLGEITSTYFVDGSGNRRAVAIIRDITERKQIEEELRKKQQLLSAMMENIPMGITIADAPNVNILEVSRYGRELTGRPADQIEGISVDSHTQQWGIFRADGVTPATNEELPLTRATQKGELVTGEEFVLARPDGTKVSILCTAAPIRDANGIITGGVIGWQDITERKRVEEENKRLLKAVQQERDRLSALVSSISDEIWFADAEKRISLVNPVVTQEFDLTISEGMNVEKIASSVEIYRPDGTPRPVDEAPLLRALRGEVLRSQEETIRTPATGELRHRQVSAAPVRDANGAILGSVSVVRDITELKRAEQAVRKAKDELEDKVRERTYELKEASLYARSLIEASIDPLVTISADGKIMDVNNASEKVTGVNRLQLIGSDFSDYFTEPEKARAGYEQVFRDGFVQDYPLELKNRDGHVTPVLYNASLYKDDTGRIMGVFAAARDISKRKVIEKKMLAAHRKLRALTSEIILAEERSRQHFAADLHDTVIQTIGAAKMRSQLIQDEIPEKASKHFKELQDFISQSITQARFIMAEMSPPVLNELGFIPALEWLTEQTEKQHGIKIEFQAAGGFTPLQHDIQVLLFQATRELLMNVVKHAHAEKVLVKMSAKRQKVRIEVIDDGKGFDKRQAFRTDVSSGGFGLFSIRERIRHFGGHLFIQSEAGKGTRVVVTAPHNSGGGDDSYKAKETSR